MSRLLVSDDDPQVLAGVQRVLEAAGHEVLATSDPSQVVGLVLDNAPDAVVLDVRMPGVSGLELLSTLRAEPRTRGLPVLFLSGLGAGADRIRALRQGADDYLVKPFEPEELVLRLERLLARSVGSLAGESSAGGRFGRYQVRGLLAEGAMGRVYRGWDPRLGRPVALKTLRLGRTGADRQQNMLRQLRHEARAMAPLSHPHIVTVYDMGEGPEGAYIAMELVEGLSLAEQLACHGPIPYREVAPMGMAVARALAAAHARGVVHRDLKPGNVLLGKDGSIKVTDFGLSNLLSSLQPGPAKVAGTPGYVAPEVLARRGPGPAADLFALGISLYECLTGINPLQGLSLKETLDRSLEARIPELRQWRPGVPGELSVLVMAMVARNPQRRPNAQQAGDQLEHLVRSQGLRWKPPASGTDAD